VNLLIQEESMAWNSDNVLKISRGTPQKPDTVKVPAADTPQTLNHKVANDPIAADTTEGDQLRILPEEAEDRPLSEWSPPRR